MSSSAFPAAIPNASATTRGQMSAADKTKLDAITGAVSGGNTGDLTLAAVGTAPAAAGASLAGQVLTLQPADATRPGLMSILAQSIAGAKTWLALAVFSLGATFDALITSNVASGSNAVKLLDGARLNFSTSDTSAYLYRSAANVIRTPGTFAVDGNVYFQSASSGTGVVWENDANLDWTLRRTGADLGLFAGPTSLYLVVPYLTGIVSATFGLSTPAEVELTTAAKGVILKSPDGTRYRLTVANGGTLSITAA